MPEIEQNNISGVLQGPLAKSMSVPSILIKQEAGYVDLYLGEQKEVYIDVRPDTLETLAVLLNVPVESVDETLETITLKGFTPIFRVVY